MVSSPVEVVLDNASSEFKALQALMSGTIAPIHVNTKANHNVPFTDLVIEKAVRLQNPILWVNYHNRTNHLRKKLIEEFGSVEKVCGFWFYFLPEVDWMIGG